MVRPSTAEVIAAGGWSEPKLPKPQPSDSASIRGEVARQKAEAGKAFADLVWVTLA
jgi:hypothetical protein